MLMLFALDAFPGRGGLIYSLSLYAHGQRLSARYFSTYGLTRYAPFSLLVVSPAWLCMLATAKRKGVNLGQQNL